MENQFYRGLSIPEPREMVCGMFFEFINNNLEGGGGGGGLTYESTGMLVVSLRGADFRFCSHLVCSGI